MPSVPRSVPALLAGVLLATGGVATTPPASAEAAHGRYTAPLRRAVGELVVRAEHRDGYERDKFVHWVDADADGCDTREEVLRAESKEEVETGDVDIDHLVPLAEAWDSGARSWTAATRQRFANDLGDRRALVAVTDNVNASKGDQDVREWLPERSTCRYVRDWVAVKHRWRLRVDRREKRALRGLADDCRNREISVRRAR